VTILGPYAYNTISQKTIGDVASVKVPFTTAIRPISARAGDLRPLQPHPGPQDYNPISVDIYTRRRSIIPKCTFSTAGIGLD
jgi:hypothetical protein